MKFTRCLNLSKKIIAIEINSLIIFKCLISHSYIIKKRFNKLKINELL